ncbi:MAG: hypothetical protein ACFE0I_05630 [Elainellaceae cyanobacterium]
MKVNRLWSGLIVLTVLVGSGCTPGGSVSVAGSNRSDQSTANEQSATTITSSDGITQLTIPADWHDTSNSLTAENWTLYVGTRDSRVSVAVKTMSKAEAPEISADLHAGAALNAGKAPFQDAEVIEQDVPTTINGYSAVMHQVRGTMMDYPMVAVTYSIETPEHYHSAAVMMLANEFERRWPQVEQVLQSFDVVESTEASAELSP